MLVYNFSNTELDKYARETVQTAIPSIRKFLEENGYHVYDEYKDGTILEGRNQVLACFSACALLRVYGVF